MVCMSKGPVLSGVLSFFYVMHVKGHGQGFLLCCHGACLKVGDRVYTPENDPIGRYHAGLVSIFKSFQISPVLIICL